MQEFIIADTTCLILFSKINSLHLLKNVYRSIILTPEVAAEYGEPLEEWMTIKPVKDFEKKLEFSKIVDWGEASAIALAIENKNSILIIDDKHGRALALKLNIELTGTLGTLLKAKENGYISAIKPLLIQLKNVNYRISPKLEQEILILANEED